MPQIYRAGVTSYRSRQCERIIGEFGGVGQLRNAVNQLQSLLYAA